MTEHDDDFEDAEEEEDDDSSDAPAKTAAELRSAYAKLNKLLTVANQGAHYETILQSITTNKRGEWDDVSLDAGILQVPLKVLGLGGGDAAFSIRTTKRPREEDAAPAKTRTDAQKALKVFQSSAVKTALRALLADTLGATNEAVCAAVEAQEREAAQAKVDAAVALLTEKKTDARAKAVDAAQGRLREVAKKPFTMPAEEAPHGDAEKAVNRVLSQLQGGLWTLAKKKLTTADALARVAGAEDPAALVQEPWFREVFQEAAKVDLPREVPERCKGCMTTGCLLCRGAAV
jgi:hypothetical protein